MEPESRRLMRAWRDEGVANQGLESGVSAFVQERSHNLNSRASTEFAFTLVVIQRWRMLFMNACYVREVLIAEELT